MRESSSDQQSNFENLESKKWGDRLDAYQCLLEVVQQAERSPSHPIWPTVRKLPQLLDNETNPKVLDTAFAIIESCLDQIATWKSFVSSFCILVASKCTLERYMKNGQNIMAALFRNNCSENVMSVLLDGTQDKNPKKCSICYALLAFIIENEGITGMNISNILSCCLKSLGHRDKFVREACKNVLVEFGVHFGPALEAELSGIQPIQRNEIMTKVMSRICETDNLNTIQPKIPPQICFTNSTSDGQLTADCMDICTLLPVNFENDLINKNWEIRLRVSKAILSAVENLCQSGDKYNIISIVPILNDALSKEINVNILFVLSKIVASIAPYLDKKNSRFSIMILSTLLLKFKERKANVVAGLSEAVDAVLESINFELASAIFMDSLNMKSSSVKAQTALTIRRCLIRIGDVPTKAVKPVLVMLINMCDSNDMDVREACIQTVATIAVIKDGNAEVNSLIQKLSTDRQKMTKFLVYKENAALELQRAQLTHEKSKTPLKKCDKLVQPMATDAPRYSTPKHMNDLLPEKKVSVNITFDASRSSSLSGMEDAFTFNRSGSNEGDSSRGLTWNDQIPTDELVEVLKQRMALTCKCGLYALLWSDNKRSLLSGLERLFEFLKCRDPGFMQNRNILLKWSIVQLYNDNNTTNVHIRLLEFIDSTLDSFIDDHRSCSAGDLVPHLLRLFSSEAREIRVKIRKLIHTLFTVMPYPFVLPHIYRMCKEASCDFHLAECIACILYILRLIVLPVELLEQVPGFILTYMNHPSEIVRNVVVHSLVYIINIWPSVCPLEEINYDDREYIEDMLDEYKKMNLIECYIFNDLEKDCLFMSTYPKLCSQK